MKTPIGDATPLLIELSSSILSQGLPHAGPTGGHESKISLYFTPPRLQPQEGETVALHV